MPMLNPKGFKISTRFVSSTWDFSQAGNPFVTRFIYAIFMNEMRESARNGLSSNLCFAGKRSTLQLSGTATIAA